MRALSPYLEGKSHIIWDWNGTLLDDAVLCVEILCELLEENELPLVTLDEYKTVFGFPVMRYYEAVGFDFAKVPFTILADRFINAYNERVYGCALFDGTPEWLASVRSIGLSQSILSAAHEIHLQKVVDHLQISHYFDAIFGLPDHYAEGKVTRGRELMAHTGLSPSQILLIGDTEHDVEVAHELGTDVLLIGDGHQAIGRLEKTGAEVIKSRYY